MGVHMFPFWGMYDLESKQIEGASRTVKTKESTETKAKKKRKSVLDKIHDTPDKKRERDEKGLFLPGNQIAAKWTEEKALALGQELIDWFHASPTNFLFQDFLLEKDIYGDIVSYLSEKYPRFSRYIARAKEMEASRIKKYALVNKLNPGMAQWVLAVHHKQYAVQKQEITGKDGGPLSPPSITIQPVAVKGKE